MLINNIAVGVQECARAFILRRFWMLTRDFITPWVICLFDPRCTSGSDYHGHSPRIQGHGKHTSSIQAGELSGWYPLMIVISSLVERAIMIGSQAPFLPHLYHILRVVSSHWLVSKGGKVWALGRVERCYSAATESIQGHSNNLQAESKKMVKLLLDGRTRIKQVNIQQLDMNKFPLSWFGMVNRAFNWQGAHQREVHVHLACCDWRRSSSSLGDLKISYPIVTWNAATFVWKLQELQSDWEQDAIAISRKMKYVAILSIYTVE